MITQERLKELLHYDPETGEFRWLKPRKGARKDRVAGGFCGRPGTSKCDYRKICIDYGQYRSSHLAWLYVYGAMPANEIDHIDGIESNDRISNLRAATREQNSFNTRRRRHSKWQYKGVRYFHKRWNARIAVANKQIHIGYFDTAELAAAAYDMAAILHHGEFAKTNASLGLLP